MLSNKVIFLGAAAVFLAIGQTYGDSENLKTPTTEKNDSVAKLRELLKSDLSEDYMKEDYWLTNWLAANEFNVENTARQLKEYLPFRKELLSVVKTEVSYEDYITMRDTFPYSLSSTDRSGRPLLYIDFDQWDIADYMTSDESSTQLIFYMAMMLEDAEAQVRRGRAVGKNITQYTELYNMGKFVSGKHLCIDCMSFYRKSSEMLAPQSAANVERIVFVNVPYVFKMVYSLLSSDTRQLTKVYGQDQKELKNMLNSYIDSDQIPKGLLNEIAPTDNSEGPMKWDKEL